MGTISIRTLSSHAVPQTSDSKELAAHCMEDIDTEFVEQGETGRHYGRRKNFGCGSSREHAPIAIKESGISCVIAASFARIFYRNAINIGLAIPSSARKRREKIQNGDEVEVDFDTGVITNVTRNEQYQAHLFPEFIKNIINKNGLLNSLKQ